MKISCVKRQGFLLPATPQDQVKLARIKDGGLVEIDATAKRNPKFHRKFFALLNLGFDAFEPKITEYKGHAVQKNFDRFREDVTIAAGHHEITAGLNGKPKLEAKSISFASMDDEEFARLFTSVCNVLLQDVLSTYTRGDIDRVIDEILHF